MWGYEIYWAVPLYYYIKIMYYNSFSNEFCTKSALQGCKSYSSYNANLFRVQIKNGGKWNQKECAHFSSRKKIWMGKMTTSVLNYMHKSFFFSSLKEIIVGQFHLWLQILPLAPTRLVILLGSCQSRNWLFFFGVLQKY